MAMIKVDTKKHQLHLSFIIFSQHGNGTYPSLSSANMGMAISDNRKSCNVQWIGSAGCHSPKMLENLSNAFANSIGYQNVSVSNIVGLDHSSW